MSRKEFKEIASQYLAQFNCSVKNNLRTIVVVGVLCVVLTLLTVFYFISGDNSRINLREYEVGRVAERDVVSFRDVSYVDETATQLRREARERLVLPVFKYDTAITDSSIKAFASFAESLRESLAKDVDELSFSFEIQEKFPGLLDKHSVTTLFRSEMPLSVLTAAETVFSICMQSGIVAIPEKGLERYNPIMAEFLFIRGGSVDRMEKKLDAVPQASHIVSIVEKIVEDLQINSSFCPLIEQLIRPFIRENLIFDEEESLKRLAEAVAAVPSVLVEIATDQRIIKKGFIITENNYRDLQAVVAAGFAGDMKELYNALLCLFISVITACLLLNTVILGRSLEFDEKVFLSVLFSFVYVCILLVLHSDAISSSWMQPLLIPAAFAVMLIAILVSEQAAVVMTFVMTVCTYGLTASTEMCSVSCCFVFVSALAGTRVLRRTEKRLDLVYSALILGGVCLVAAPLLMKVSGNENYDTGLLMVGAFFAGFLSGILVIGFLPMLEAAMNTATVFRLMELSDLNSPIMKKFMIAAPGSYNHSLMVANLAETACRDIGANPLLARVGSYFHDIGKMDQPEYFTENQAEYNKHDAISTRLSATVIRSHVKLGVEKARQLHLPQEVVDIIAEHHGNSVIQFFYAEAVKEEGDSVNPEDFSYPGNPPRSKESAVIMLADTVEAACRTLQHPSVSRLERFIAELINAKIVHKQLDNADLSFRDLDNIRKNFVQVLAGYYHSRIEYPNQKDPDEELDASPVLSVNAPVVPANPITAGAKRKKN